MRHYYMSSLGGLVTLAVLAGGALAQRGHSGGHGAAPARPSMGHPTSGHYSQPTSRFVRPMSPSPARNRSEQSSLGSAPRTSRPTAASAPRTTRTTVVRNRATTRSGLGLTDLDNQQLLAAKNQVGPKTQAAITAALEGKPLTPQQTSYLQGALEKNSKLNPAQKAAIAAALQHDRQEKHRPHGPGYGGASTTIVAADGTTLEDSGGSTVGANEGTDDAGDYRPAASGVKITDMREGPARRQGLMPGDIILSVNGVATPTGAALAAALQGADGEAEVVFRNVESGAVESVVLRPEDGRIGIWGETVALP